MTESQDPGIIAIIQDNQNACCLNNGVPQSESPAITLYLCRSVFKMFTGTHKNTNEPVSVFKFEVTPATTPEQKAAAKAEFKRIRYCRGT